MNLNVSYASPAQTIPQGSQPSWTYIKCKDFIKNENGDVKEIYCTYDPTTKGGWSDDGRKVRGTLQWVAVEYAIDAEVRLYEHMFKIENPE